MRCPPLTSVSVCVCRMLSGKSPGVGRRLQPEDRFNLISSPTESEAGSLELYADNGNEGIEFVPKTTKIGALNQVIGGFLDVSFF